LQNRPKPDIYLQPYIDAFTFFNSITPPEKIPSLNDLFLYADENLEDRMEFAQIMSQGFKALAKANKDKADTNDRIKKPRKH